MNPAQPAQLGKEFVPRVPGARIKVLSLLTHHVIADAVFIGSVWLLAAPPRAHERDCGDGTGADINSDRGSSS